MKRARASKAHRIFRFAISVIRDYPVHGLVFIGVAVLSFCVTYFAVPVLFRVQYDKMPAGVSAAATSTPAKNENIFVATHEPTPFPVKGIYMTSCVAGSKTARNNLVKLIADTELNSVVIDIKDYSGGISFVPYNPELKKFVSDRCVAADMPEFIASLHAQNIYVIGRITVFQDPLLAAFRPDLAVKKKSDGTTWKDFKGISFTDPGSREVWDHTVLIAKESYNIGFDELNFDYIRFPSDGPMEDIYYSWSIGKKKSDVLAGFFSYLNEKLKPTGVVLSADLFGMTTTNTNDLNIGQVLENTLPYFDYVSPMVYPSHYPPTFLGYKNPAAYPYEVVRYSLDAAVKRTVASTTLAEVWMEKPISTTTKPFAYRKEIFNADKIRPWLQDFNLGAVYTADMVDKQIKAVYDSGLSSWILWNASNRYTAAALQSAGVKDISTAGSTE